MRFLIFVVLVATISVGVYAQLAVTEQPEDVETTVEKPILEEEDECLPGMCTRLYQPLCASIDGELLTAASPCEWENKKRCALKNARKLSRSIQELNLIMHHSGPCRGNENSNSTSNTRANRKNRKNRRNNQNRQNRKNFPNQKNLQNRRNSQNRRNNANARRQTTKTRQSVL